VRSRRILLAAVPLGLAVFVIVKWVNVLGDAEGQADPQVGVWELMVAASVVLWTALAAVGVGMLDKLPRRDVGGLVLAVYGAILLLLVFTLLAGIHNQFVVAGQQWKNFLLHVIALVTITPWLVALERIRVVADDDDEWAPTAKAIARIQEHRRWLHAATAALGGMIALAVILTGGLREAVTAAGLEPTPDSYVLVYGAWLTALLAGLYLRVFSAVERRARWIVCSAVPLPDPGSDGFSAAVERRAQVGQELQLGGNARANLESLISVLAPLIGALLTRFGGL
jgi:hypothetical protein